MMITVTPQRFREIFAYDRYVSKIQKGSFYERSSCPYYDVIDTDTNEVVGVFSDGSWENTFKVIIELASKEDIIAHYEKIIKWNESEIESYKRYNKKLREYKNFTAEQRAEYDRKELEEAELRKNSPGLYQFLEEVSVIYYDVLSSSYNFTKLFTEVFNNLKVNK